MTINLETVVGLRAELVEGPQHEPLTDDPAVQRVKRGGLPPHLALKPARRRGQVPLELRPQRVTLGGQLYELGPRIGRRGGIDGRGHVVTSLRTGRGSDPFEGRRASGRWATRRRAAGSRASAVSAPDRSGS